jgi:hypothetical protein
MLVHAIIIQVETPLILLWVLAPWAVNQTQPVAAIAQREPLQLLLVPLIARAAGLPRQIIARPAIVHLEQLDIASRVGRTQELHARRPGRPQELSAPPGQQAAHSNVQRWIRATLINLVALL